MGPPRHITQFAKLLGFLEKTRSFNLKNTLGNDRSRQQKCHIEERLIEKEVEKKLLKIQAKISHSHSYEKHHNRLFCTK